MMLINNIIFIIINTNIMSGLENLDLDINNYNLNDLLNLFQLPMNFSEEHLKNAKKMKGIKIIHKRKDTLVSIKH